SGFRSDRNESRLGGRSSYGSERRSGSGGGRFIDRTRGRESETSADRRERILCRSGGCRHLRPADQRARVRHKDCARGTWRQSTARSRQTGANHSKCNRGSTSESDKGGISGRANKGGRETADLGSDSKLPRHLRS